MLIDMILDNDGEPPFKTRYRDPRVLAAYGYRAIVIPKALAAIPAAYEPAGAKGAGHGDRLRSRKPREIEEQIDIQVRAAAGAGMKVFFYGDGLMLPRAVVLRRPAHFLCDDPSGRLCPGKPAVLEALEDQVQELFDRWPAAVGLVMQTGEVRAAAPHMLGSALGASNCPTCRAIGLQDRLVAFIQRMHDVVIGELGRMYVHRAWAPAAIGSAGAGRTPSLHDDPEFYRAVSGRLPASRDLAFSFQFARANQAGGQCVNPCLFADDRPKWIEFQCEREFEGKGAFPNYQAAAWSEFLRQLNFDATAAGLDESQVRERFSLWGQSRGGGWGGPHVQREEWIDANVHALAELFKNPLAEIQDIATAWAGAAFGVAESSPPAPAIAELLLISAPMIRKLLCTGTQELRLGGSPWVRDDLLDAEAIWEAAGRMVDAGVAEEACREKAEALVAADRIRELFDLALLELPNKGQARDLANELAYFSSFAGTVARLCRGFVYFAQWARAARTDAGLAQSAAAELKRAQADWQRHTQRDALLPGAPSVFHEHSLWDRTNDCLEQLAAVA